MKVIEIPFVPPSLNQMLGRHWRSKHAVKLKWLEYVRLYGGPSPSVALPKARLAFTRHSSLPLDYDNLVASFKPVTDALVNLGYIVDDSYDVIGVPSFSWVKSPRKDVKIVIEISEI